MLFGYPPFWDTECMERIIPNIKTGSYEKIPKRWKKVSRPGQEFVEGLLLVDPARRFSAEQALQHPWIQTQASDMVGATHSEQVGDVVDALCTFGNASRFRRACMSMMAWSLSNEERAQVRDAFLAMDKDQTGTIK